MNKINVWIKGLAKEAGLPLAGVCLPTADVLTHANWAKSVIVVGLPYNSLKNGTQALISQGLVARVARNNDYHSILRDKLASLSVLIQRDYKCKYEICVDTSPILERKLALKAGIAWQGKNGNVVSNEYGSYIVIGEIITNIELEPINQEQISGCGNCNLCINACPTGAIDDDNGYHANKCLSYITQSSGHIPRDVRAKLENRIYGCDVCQEVCPKNRGLKYTSEDFIDGVYPGAFPDLLMLINMTTFDYNSIIKMSSIGWIGRTKLRRNAIIAAANNMYAESIFAIIPLLNSKSAVIRAHSAWALGKLNDITAIEPLLKRLDIEDDISVTDEIKQAIDSINPEG